MRTRPRIQDDMGLVKQFVDLLSPGILDAIIFKQPCLLFVVEWASLQNGERHLPFEEGHRLLAAQHMCESIAAAADCTRRCGSGTGGGGSAGPRPTFAFRLPHTPGSAGAAAGADVGSGGGAAGSAMPTLAFRLSRTPILCCPALPAPRAARGGTVGGARAGAGRRRRGGAAGAAAGGPARGCRRSGRALRCRPQRRRGGRLAAPGVGPGRAAQRACAALPCRVCAPPAPASRLRGPARAQPSRSACTRPSPPTCSLGRTGRRWGAGRALAPPPGTAVASVWGCETAGVGNALEGRRPAESSASGGPWVAVTPPPPPPLGRGDAAAAATPAALNATPPSATVTNPGDNGRLRGAHARVFTWRPWAAGDRRVAVGIASQPAHNRHFRGRRTMSGPR